MGKAENMGMRMDNKRAKSARSAFGLAVFLFSLLVICRIATSVEPGVPDEKQLVAFYQATAQKSLFQRDRWIVEAKSQRTTESPFLLKTSARKYVEKHTVYRDRGRLDSRTEQIRMNFPEEEDRIDKRRRQYVILDDRVYSYTRWVPEGQQPLRIIASNDLTSRVLYSAGVDVLALAGYMSVKEKPLAEILAEESSVLHVQPSMQMVNGFPTYVLEATTPYGHYTVWMDPNCGYSPRRVIVERGPDDLYGGKPVSARSGPSRPTFERARFVLDILKIKEIGGGFMATEGTTTTTHVYSTGSIERTHGVCELALVDLHPDFNDVPDAFVLDVPDGTRVFDDDFPVGTFKWQNGQMVSLDIGPVSLLGEPLPELKDSNIDLPPADADDKMILVCFWDMQQRSSRHCISQLAKRAEELKEKGVAVVTVQASKVDENALSEWLKKYKIPFPVGMVQCDVEKSRLIWSVRYLPWLILTDRKHIVRAEGFTLTELDEKLNGNSKN